MLRRWLGSLVNRAVLLVVAAILLTSLAVTLSNSVVSRHELKSQTEAQLATIAELIASELDHKLAVRIEAINDVAHSLVMEELAFNSRAQLLVNRQLALRHLFDGIFLVNTDGRIIGEYPERLNLKGLDVSVRRYFQHVSVQLTPLISEPFESAIEQAPMVMIAAPVLDHRGRFIGLLAGAIRLDSENFLADIADIRIGETGYIGVVSRHGLTLAHGRDPSQVMATVPGNMTVMNEARAGYEGVRYDRNLQNTEVMVAIRQINQAPWFVAALWPLKEALAPTHRLTESLAWVMLGVLVVLAPMALVIFRRQLAPMKDLVTQISDRHIGVRSQAVRVGGGREIRRVADIFNRVMDERSEVVQSLADREAFFRSLSSSAPIGILQADVLGRVEFVNPAFEGIVGADASELRHRNLISLIHPDDRAEATRSWFRARNAGTVFRSRFRIFRLSDECELWIDVMSARIDTRDKSLGTITVVRDITHELEVEAALTAEKQRAESILGILQEGVLLTNASGDVRYANSGACTYLGTDGFCEGVNFFDTVTIEAGGDCWGRADFLAESEVPVLDAVLHNARGEAFDVELTMLRLNRGEGTERLVFVLRDDSERRRQEERLSWEATHDSLTGLLNRRAFMSSLVKWLGEAASEHTASVLMLIDLDHFKPVNDLGGHLLGDELLKRLATVLMNSVRQSDAVARLGGDEFGVLLPACGLKRAEALAEDIRVAVEALVISQDEREFRVTASIGVTELSATDTGPRETVARADEGCYAAKAQGRNTVVLVPLPPEDEPLAP